MNLQSIDSLSMKSQGVADLALNIFRSMGESHGLLNLVSKLYLTKLKNAVMCEKRTRLV